MGRAPGGAVSSLTWVSQFLQRSWRLSLREHGMTSLCRSRSVCKHHRPCLPDSGKLPISSVECRAGKHSEHEPRFFGDNRIYLTVVRVVEEHAVPLAANRSAEIARRIRFFRFKREAILDGRP